METSNRGFRLQGRLSFAASHSLTYPKRERLAAVKKHMEAKEHSLDIPMSPLQAMEYLSRSWSPSSSDFFQILSLNSLLPPSKDDMPDQREGKIEGEDTNEAMLLGNKGKRVDDIWACLASGRPISSSHQNPKTHRSTGWMNVGHMKAWFGGEILGSLSRTCREKRKEELRLHMAQVHAALSVAQLAAAVAGIVSDGSPHHLLSSKHRLPLSGGSPSDGKMNAAVASAAAFVAAVCAEAAESAGASRAHIASAISSGLAMQTPADMLTLTATAATCLRGAATLKLRASSPASWHVQEEGREMLAKGAELPIRTPPGKIHIRMVCVYTKRDKLMLRLGRKYLQGALTIHKEYRIIKAEVETKEGIFRNDLYGFCLLVLGTTGGTIEVLFDDDRQSKIWKSTISHLLCDQEMLSP